MSAIAQPGDVTFEQQRPLSVVVVYSDQIARTRAMDIYHRLQHQLWDEYDFSVGWWKTDHLTHPQIACGAAEAAAGADLIFVAIESGSDLSLTLKNWIGQWLPLRNRAERALFVLVEIGEHASNPDSGALIFLRKAARWAGMDFLTHRATAAEVEAPATNPTASAKPTPSAIKEMSHLTTPVQRWGLNE